MYPIRIYKRVIVFTIALLTIIYPTINAQTTKDKIAVYLTGDIQEGKKKVISSKLVTGITESSNYIAIERTSEFMNLLNREIEHELSGAVSDEEIAQIGKQFGVQYVLAGEAFEVYESTYLTARIIDVNTAEITRSAEAQKVVNDLNSLISLSEETVFKLFSNQAFGENDVSFIGPINNVKSLSESVPPGGYHIATIDEINTLLKNRKFYNIKVKTPIYTEITHSYTDIRQDYSVRYYPKNKSSKSAKVDYDHRFYRRCDVNYTIVYGSTNKACMTAYFCVDPYYRIDRERISLRYDDGYDYSIRGFNNEDLNFTLDSGYICIIKNY